jgi:hypothetical protein
MKFNRLQRAFLVSDELNLIDLKECSWLRVKIALEIQIHSIRGEERKNTKYSMDTKDLNKFSIGENRSFTGQKVGASRPR